MRVRVDEGKCQGHTLCNMVAPEVFGLREEDGHSYLLMEQIPERLQEAVRRACENCPEEAISVSE
jgi:ferredoxin